MKCGALIDLDVDLTLLLCYAKQFTAGTSGRFMEPVLYLNTLGSQIFQRGPFVRCRLIEFRFRMSHRSGHDLPS